MKNETMDIDAASVAATGELSITESQTEEEVNGEEDVGQQRPAEYKKKPLAVTACELCKARKVRCDRAEPSCGWCTRNRRVCVYKERQKPGFRAGYVRELETKVNKLEAMLQMLGRRVEDHISSKDLGQTGPINLERLLSMANDSASPQNQHPQTPSVVGTQSPDTSSHERVRPARAAELMSVQSMMNTSRSTDMTGAPPELPPVEMLYSLVDLYFKHVNTWCPILDRQITVEGLFRSSKHDEADRIVLYAMVATALRFSKDPSLTSVSRERYHTFAKERVLLHSLQTPSIKSLQALVILTWDFLGSSDGPASVNILAVLVRSVLQLNLQLESGLSLSSAVRAHAPPGRLRDTVLPQPSSWIEEEGRRRLFWMIYVIERYAAVATAADLVLDETEIDRSLPCRYDLFSKNHPVETRWFCGPGRSRMIINQPENLGSFSYHCEVTRILSRVQQFLQTPVDICSMSEVERWQSTYRELDDELSAWLSNLPDDYSRISQLCHSDPTSKISNWIIMHAAFVTSVVRLHSCAAYPPVRSYIFAPSYNASQRCLTAVQSLREIAQDVLNTSMLDLLGPHFAFSLYAAARLLLVHTACTGTETDTSCQFFIDVLDEMGNYWSIARQYAQQLDQIWKRAHMEWQIGGETTKSAPKALAIMRRRAYEVHISAIQRPSSAMKPLPTKPATVEDIEYLEVFHFFNYPRLPASMVNSQSLFDYFLNVDAISSGKDYFMAAAPLPMGSSEMGWSYST